MTRGDLRRRMSSQEFSQWEAFDRVSPIGDQKMELYLAQLTAVVGASSGVEMPLEDCLIKFGKKETTEEDQDEIEKKQAVSKKVQSFFRSH